MDNIRETLAPAFGAGMGFYREQDGAVNKLGIKWFIGHSVIGS
jgi:hypothetical protein